MWNVGGGRLEVNIRITVRITVAQCGKQYYSDRKHSQTEIMNTASKRFACSSFIKGGWYSIALLHTCTGGTCLTGPNFR